MESETVRPEGIADVGIDYRRASVNGDLVIHFHHPTWRADRNDPSTVPRLNIRKGG
jgi:hypothetical protein